MATDTGRTWLARAALFRSGYTRLYRVIIRMFSSISNGTPISFSDSRTPRSGKMMPIKARPKKFTGGRLPGKWQGEKNHDRLENPIIWKFTN